MKIVEITEAKKTELAEGIEEMLRIGGRLMSCVEELGEEDDHMAMRRGGSRMGYRDNSMGYRGRGGYRMNEKSPMGRGGYMQYEDPYYE